MWERVEVGIVASRKGRQWCRGYTLASGRMVVGTWAAYEEPTVPAGVMVLASTAPRRLPSVVEGLWKKETGALCYSPGSIMLPGV